MIPKRLVEIGYPEIEALVEGQVAEGRTIEFKRDLPGGRDADVKEFLADLTSLANSNGGDLVYGIEETEGVATGLPGLNAESEDRVILRLESIARTGIEPRLSGLSSRWINSPNGTAFLVIRAPASLASPHRVTHGGSSRFYARSSKGKYEMDTHELRLAFTATEGFSVKLRGLHEIAVDNARGVNMPFSMDQSLAYSVVSVIPISFFSERRDLPIDRNNAVSPMRNEGGLNYITTIDGIVCHPSLLPSGGSYAFTMTHRSGRVDSAFMVGRSMDIGQGAKNVVWADYFERGLLNLTESVQRVMKPLDVEGPWAVFASVVGVSGFSLVLNNNNLSRPAWLQTAKLPELIVDRPEENAFKPMFEAFWRIFGLERPPDRKIQSW